MRRNLVRLGLAALAGATLAATVTAAPASALVGPSQPDPTDTEIGALLPIPAMPVPKICGVTLVSSRVGVIAGHCAAIRIGVFGTDRSAVSFSSDVSASLTGGTVVGTTYPGTLVVDPMYDPNTDAHDLGAIVFDSPVTDITPTALPDAGFLDGLVAGSSASGLSARLIGYGTTQRSPGNVFTGAGERRTTDNSVRALTPRWLVTAAGPDQAASCDLDSGGPVFVNGQFTAVITLGDNSCSTLSRSARVDLPEDLAWLDGLVSDPPMPPTG
jgi:hypothetical protein